MEKQKQEAAKVRGEFIWYDAANDPIRVALRASADKRGVNMLRYGIVVIYMKEFPVTAYKPAATGRWVHFIGLEPGEEPSPELLATVPEGA